MDQVMSVDEFAVALYGESTRGNRTTICRQCRDGVIRNAEKLGNRWYINATKELPRLFGEVEPESAMPGRKEPGGTVPIGADTTLGELSRIIAGLANGRREE